MAETGKTVEQLDAEVKAAEAELEARRADAEKIVERLVVSLVPLVQAYFERTVANIAVEEHEITTKLGPRLAAVKQELQAIVATKVPEKVRQWIATDDWPHRPANQTYTYGDVGWNVDAKGDRGPHRVHVNFENSLTAFIRTSMSKHGYKANHHYGPSWKGEPATIVSEYAGALKAFQNARTRHHGAVTERSKFEAKSLWEKA